jgi:serine phosphatase RsbU (regulator of sigma subunit)/glutaredoxin-related protein
LKKTLNTEILFWLLSFTLSSILLLAFSNYYSIHKKNEIDNIVQEVNQLHLLCLKDFKLHNDFINHESINPLYFITGRSKLLNQNEVIDDSIKSIISDIEKKSLTQRSGCKPHLKHAENYFNSYEKNFDSVTTVLFKRGFKDWGYEGKMRDNAHQLEQFKKVDKITILQLRRREKDFIIRLDTAYITDVKSYANTIIANALKTKSLQNDSIIRCSKLYLLYFDSLVSCELKLGFRNHSGLKKNADDIASLLDDEMSKLVHLFDRQKKELYQTMYSFYAFILIAFVLLSIFISLHIARKISKPIKRLSDHIDAVVVSEFNLEEKLTITNTNFEVQQLYQHFARMQSEIFDYLNYFKRKVDERTKEINQQMEEINQQKEFIQEQKTIVDQHNTNITDSIKYALKIQQSMLPDEESIKQMAPNSFVLYKPKDIVSGDFYFIDIINVLGTEKLIFIAADGTGHGVPGAFMSLLGLNNINRTIYGLGETKPQVILSVLNHALVQSLRKKHNKYNVTDSMDVAFCKIDMKNLKMEFVGANRPCYIIRNNNLIEIKGDRLSIGSESVITLENKLTSHIIDLELNDCVYIFTDGFCDQFGGLNNKKFKKKDFVEILKSIHLKEMNEQKAMLNLVFENWKNSEAQTDDVLIMGIKITQPNS